MQRQLQGRPFSHRVATTQARRQRHQTQPNQSTHRPHIPSPLARTVVAAAPHTPRRPLNEYDTLKLLVERVKNHRPEYVPTQTIIQLEPHISLLLKSLPSPAATSMLELLLWAYDQCGLYDKMRGVAKGVVKIGQNKMPSVLWNRVCYLVAPSKCDRSPLGQAAQWLAGAVDAIDHTNLIHDVFRLPHREIAARILLVMQHFPLGDTFTLHRLIMGLTSEELRQIAIQQALYNVGAPKQTACLPAHAIRKRPKIIFTGEDFNARPTGLLIRRFIDHLPPDMELAVMQIGNPTPSDNDYSFRTKGVDYYEVKSPEEARNILDRNRYDAIVDTKGLMFKNHCCLLQPRRAPLQVHWLAYPGTLGVPTLDYTIGDPVVTPSDGRRQLVEKVIRMPECYQINDDAFSIRSISPIKGAMRRQPGRMLIACVNMNYKICPETILAWQQILRTCPHVDLAIVCRTTKSKAAIALAFKAAHFRPERIQSHLGQGRLQFLANMRRDVDLVVDPFRCPGHTTASDAFTAGVPVVSLLTDTYHGSVAQSLTRQIGLENELTATTSADYVGKVINLLQHPDQLNAIRSKIRQQRRWSTLYDPKRYMDHFWDGMRAALTATKKGGVAGDIDVKPRLRFTPVPIINSNTFTIKSLSNRAVIRLLFDDNTQVMVSEFHGEVWVGERLLTDSFTMMQEGRRVVPKLGDNHKLRFTRSAKGTCVLQGSRPVLLGIPFPKSVSIEDSVMLELGESPSKE